MNNNITKILIALFIIVFIEVQVILFFCIKNNIDINKINNNPNTQQDSRMDFGNNFNRGTPPNMDNEFNNDISKDAITPENNQKSNKNNKSNNNA